MILPFSVVRLLAEFGESSLCKDWAWQVLLLYPVVVVLALVTSTPPHKEIRSLHKWSCACLLLKRYTFAGSNPFKKKQRLTSPKRKLS